MFAGGKVTINNIGWCAQLGEAGAIERVLVGLREERFKHGAVGGIPWRKAKRSWYGNGADLTGVNGALHVFECGEMTHASRRPSAGTQAFVGGRKCLYQPDLWKLETRSQGGGDQASYLRRVRVVTGCGRHEERRAPWMGYHKGGSDQSLILMRCPEVRQVYAL